MLSNSFLSKGASRLASSSVAVALSSPSPSSSCYRWSSLAATHFRLNHSANCTNKVANRMISSLPLDSLMFQSNLGSSLLCSSSSSNNSCFSNSNIISNRYSKNSNSISISSYSRSSSRATSYSTSAKRQYHTYPDPDETAVVTTHMSDFKKTINKGGKDATTGSTSSIPVAVNKAFRLDQQFPDNGLVNIIGKSEFNDVKVSTLKNSLRVGTSNLPSFMSSFAIIVKTGSSYEKQDLYDEDSSFGCTHALEMIGFKSNKFNDVASAIEKLGGMFQCISNRETILYCVDVLRPNLAAAVEILAEAIIDPSINDEDVEEIKKIMEYQQQELPSDVLSKDLIVRAAFSGNPLGQHHFCPSDAIPHLTRDKILRFRSKYYNPKNSFVSATGVDHDTFLALVEKHFASYGSSSSSKDGEKVGESAAVVASSTKPSQFVGGLQCQERSLKEPFVRVNMGFECGGWSDDMLIATCVLSQLLGGGSSFSAGGPGKGMYTRLYTQVLNQYHWVESAEAYMNINDSAGMIGIETSTKTEHISNMIRVIVDQLVRLGTEPISNEEFDRAKNMLRSMMMMQLESRLVLCEDICRQFTTYERRETPQMLAAKIIEITKEDLVKVVQRMFSSPPAVSVIGDDIMKNTPQYDDISKFTKSYWEEAVMKAAARRSKQQSKR